MFFPYGDNNPTRRFPAEVLTIIIINVIVFAIFGFQENYIKVVESFGFTPAKPSVIDIFTSLFLHGDIFHLIFNMWFLWLFGDNIEDIAGRTFFPVFYLMCGVVSNVVHALMNSGSHIPLIGASGAISGLMGAYFFLSPKSKVNCFTMILFKPITFQMSAFWFLFLYFGENLLSGFLSAGSKGGGVAFWAHIGGFVFGYISFLIMVKAGFAVLRSAEKVKTGDWATLTHDELLKEEFDMAVKKGNYANFINKYNIFMIAHPHKILPHDFYMNMCKKFGELKEFKLEIECLKKLLVYYPETNSIHQINLRLGMLLWREEKLYKESVDYFRKVISTEPQSQEAAVAREEIKLINNALKQSGLSKK